VEIDNRKSTPEIDGGKSGTGGKVRKNSLSGHFPFSGAFWRGFLRLWTFCLTGQIGWNPLISKGFSGGGGENRTRYSLQAIYLQ
jgi:hypothetical protein